MCIISTDSLGNIAQMIRKPRIQSWVVYPRHLPPSFPLHPILHAIGSGRRTDCIVRCAADIPMSGQCTHARSLPSLVSLPRYDSSLFAAIQLCASLQKLNQMLQRNQPRPILSLDFQFPVIECFEPRQVLFERLLKIISTFVLFARFHQTDAIESFYPSFKLKSFIK